MHDAALRCTSDNAIILDVEASRAIRQTEVGASRTMIDRIAQRFGLKPKRLAADSAYGSAANLAWLADGAGERLLRAVGPRFEEIDAELTALSELREKPSGNFE